ncbi:trypsin-like serine peptidase [Deinococcus sp. YIM 134068]|uniref:trypsin-like serine peptidase n=1 Tax=Deinococcus lichenicola TaxID=3118910 RepID=UPI003FA4B182
MYFEDTRLSTGTAFVIEYRGFNYLITNKHNVTGRNPTTNQPLSPTGGVPDKMVVWFNAEALGYWRDSTFELYNSDRRVWREHPQSDGTYDFVSFRLDALPSRRFYPYRFSDGPQDLELSPSDRVNVIGFPFGLSAGGKLAIWSSGFIASDLAINYDEKPIFLIDCRSRQGQSGSPVIFHSSTGQYSSTGGFHISTGPVTLLLGIYSGRVNNESDIGVVWKVEAIRQLLDHVHPQ